MPRPRRSLKQEFYDVFYEWPVEDQRAALEVLNNDHRRKVRELENERRRNAPGKQIPLREPEVRSAEDFGPNGDATTPGFFFSPKGGS